MKGPSFRFHVSLEEVGAFRRHALVLRASNNAVEVSGVSKPAWIPRPSSESDSRPEHTGRFMGTYSLHTV